jgi:hypothetical protein
LAESGDAVELQLRRTEPSGQPDLSDEGLIGTASQSVTGPGLIAFEPRWIIPESDRGNLLSLTLVTPQTGLSTVTLEHQSGDPYPDGSLFESIDTITTPIDGDLWFRIFGARYENSGTVAFDLNGDSPTLWTGGRWEADVEPPTTVIRTRFAFAESPEELDTPIWTEWMTTTPFTIPSPGSGRWVRAEVSLETSNNSQTPILRAFEIDYEAETGSAVHGLPYR